VALAILMELNIRLTVLVVETARLERRGVNDSVLIPIFIMLSVVKLSLILLSIVILIFDKLGAIIVRKVQEVIVPNFAKCLQIFLSCVIYPYPLK
jgi:hypothetical protein